jgi:hypothetical protein
MPQDMSPSNTTAPPPYTTSIAQPFSSAPHTQAAVNGDSLELTQHAFDALRIRLLEQQQLADAQRIKELERQVADLQNQLNGQRRSREPKPSSRSNQARAALLRDERLVCLALLFLS